MDGVIFAQEEESPDLEWRCHAAVSYPHSMATACQEPLYLWPFQAALNRTLQAKGPLRAQLSFSVSGGGLMEVQYSVFGGCF